VSHNYEFAQGNKQPIVVKNNSKCRMSLGE